MKKLVFITLIGSLIILLTGCSDASGVNGDDDPKNPDVEVSQNDDIGNDTEDKSAPLNIEGTEGNPERALTPEGFEEKLKGEKVVVLDVRSTGERSEGALYESIHMPHTEILEDPTTLLSELPVDKDTTILIHCGVGKRAGMVVDEVAELGYPNTYYLDHFIQISEDGSYTFEKEQ